MKALIAVDSSDMAEKILVQVCEAKWCSDVEFRIVSIVDSAASTETSEQLVHQAQLILDDRITRFKSKLFNHKVDGAIIEGVLPDAIIEEAKDQKADLLIIGSHGETGCRRPELGSVASDVVKRAPCTVQVIKVCKEAETLNASAVAR
ncbi:MAG TPA: universal stress protein [Candidatus Melainabacteria bacterium]|jgi:universal stress protein A|nr:universal stress protein [Candidatus Melainabacteria bacterium]HIN65718.1 universal stress protein [Candidatus Obscuribacterales bacterium]